MERNKAVIGAVALTAVIALALLFFSVSRRANAGPLPAAVPPAAAVAAGAAADGAQSEYEAELAAREAAKLDQVAQRQAAIAGLDANYSEQLAALEQQLADTNDALLAASQRLESLQSEAQGVQDDIAVADASFQGEMTRLQNGLAARDQALRLQIETAYAQLQSAYDQLAARASAAQASSDDSSNPPPAGNSGDHDDHDDHDDHNDDHEDEHEDGDDD